MRVLVITNLVPDEASPQRGRWVRDQIDATRARGVDVDVFGFPPGRAEYRPATRRLRTLLEHERFDLVHAHYGLAGWVARRAGAAPLLVTFHGTDVRHGVAGPLSRRLAWRAAGVAAVSRALFTVEDGRPGLPAVPGRSVLPCGPDLDRFGPRPRTEARRELGLDPERRYLFFPADPGRPGKRHDLAAALAASLEIDLLVGGGIDPDAMPVWMNAADVVVVPSDREGFGLAAVEALACDVPVLATPVGIAPYALAGIAGCLCAPFDLDSWAAAAAPHLAADDPRVGGAARAATLSAGRMADRVIEVYRHMTRERQ